VVAIVGRPNVGKSALFNRLAGGRDALVADTPAPGGHTTRDWREGLGRLGGMEFRVVDTSGLEPAVMDKRAGEGGRGGRGDGDGLAAAAAAEAPLQARAALMTAGVLARSHVALLVLDAAAGVCPADLELGRFLRRQRGLWRRQGDGAGVSSLPPSSSLSSLPPPPPPVAGPSGPATLLVLNKAEARAARARMPETLADVHANLGLLLPEEHKGGRGGDDGAAADGSSADAAGAATASSANDGRDDHDGDDDDDGRIVALSAQSGEGLADLYVALRPHLQAAAAELRRQHGLPPAAAADSSGGDDDGDGDDDEQEAGDEAAAGGALWPAALPPSPLLWPPARPPPPLPGDPPRAGGAATPGPTPAPTGAPSDKAPPSPAPPAHLLPDWPRPEDGPMRVAIMGLPNAGKSTLLNALLGAPRALTGPEPGLTRDAPCAWLEWRGGLRVELTDTAGWVPRSEQPALAAADVKGAGGRGGGASDRGGGGGEAAEARRLSAAALERGRRAMDAAHVVVLLLDAGRLDRDGRLITKAELGLAAEAVRAGKALVVGLNKADLLEGGGGGGRGAGGGAGGGGRGGGRGTGGGGRGAAASPALANTWPEASKMAAELAAALDARFAEAGKPAVVALSALGAGDGGDAGGSGGGPAAAATDEGRAGAAAVLDACAVAYARWNRRAGTSAVRRALDRCAARLAGSPAGAAVGRVKWAAQIKARPPTFALSLRGARPLVGGAERFLAGALREGLGLEGVPVRVSVRYNAREGDDEAQARGGAGGGARAGVRGGRGGGRGRGAGRAASGRRC